MKKACFFINTFTLLFLLTGPVFATSVSVCPTDKVIALSTSATSPIKGRYDADETNYNSNMTVSLDPMNIMGCFRKDMVVIDLDSIQGGSGVTLSPEDFRKAFFFGFGAVASMWVVGYAVSCVVTAIRKI